MNSQIMMSVQAPTMSGAFKIIPSSDAYENKNGGKKFEGGYSSSILTPALKRNARLKQTLLTRVPNNENVSSRYSQVAEQISMNGRNSSMT